ncbi:MULTISPECIES: cell division protein ZipA C-terminal FtsZ-binding domain-containing protein [unclassified Psychrobacter]|uniref:cell division protein ZipA C-terminal FtsZ-binding domain-containing protein n=1 Tax=unclassified Psychrobacter TaxID=196806 RepID=UPI00078E4202|nr:MULTISPECIES: cell division protein ZipA C-terminal FtsZ-binding domain-containing protein [unclassified Psychrobacter]AMN48826.1 cell division protein [Psychrobacter sp. P2G3]AMN66646.1 cell division protein [Psychrobacter sp. P11G5]
MTAIQFVLIAIAAFIVLAGLFMVIRSFKRRNSAEIAAVNYDKNGIPIIPRHERNIVDQPDLDDTVAGETTIAPDRDYLNAVIEDEPLTETHTNVDAQLTQGRGDTAIDESAENNEDYVRWQDEQQRADNAEFVEVASEMQGDNEYEPDAFSSLMSATDSLMPVIDTAEEPSFDDNSPILDQHLLEPVDQAQNGPLINAKDNINITILPRQYRDRPVEIIRGRDLLALIDKYGLRFGAMNMFHRYEQKDGTGMLWFSMMGITDSGIAPFDPHSVATNTYNGVVVFLSLPHPQALRSFDSMMSIAYMMADDLNAMMLDESNEPITPEYKQQLRNQVRDYEV